MFSLEYYLWHGLCLVALLAISIWMERMRVKFMYRAPIMCVLTLGVLAVGQAFKT